MLDLLAHKVEARLPPRTDARHPRRSLFDGSQNRRPPTRNDAGPRRPTRGEQTLNCSVDRYRSCGHADKPGHTADRTRIYNACQGIRTHCSVLERGGLSVYLDVIDTQLGKSGPDLADYIRSQLDKCTQLLPLISPQTQASWWVPWEIGAATEKEGFLASFVSGATIPDFCSSGPIFGLSQISISTSES